MRSLKDPGKENRRRHTVAGSAVWEQTEEALLAEQLRNCLRWREVGTLIGEHHTLLGPFLRHQPVTTPDHLLQILQTYFSGQAQSTRPSIHPESPRSTAQSSSNWQEWLVNDLLGLRNLGGIHELLSLASIFAVSTDGTTAGKEATDAHWIEVAQKFAERRQKVTVDDLAARAEDIRATLRAARGRKLGEQSPSSRNKAW